MLKSTAIHQQCLTGQTDAHLEALPGKGLPLPRPRLHRDIIVPFLRLQTKAADAGFQLTVASSFRSFEQQCAIWNAKASGQRPVLDDQGEPLDINSLSPWQQVQAILRWSALPGASRHHWGTDMDVYDPSLLPPGYVLQLTRAETEGSGPLAALHQWLGEMIATGEAEGFYRPYDSDRGGVAPEPWHLSYGPLADQFSQALGVAQLREAIVGTDLLLAETVLEHLDDIYQRFVQVPGMIS